MILRLIYLPHSRSLPKFLLVFGLIGFSISLASAQRIKFRPQVHEVGVRLYGGNATFATESLAFQSQIIPGLHYRYHPDIRQAFYVGLAPLVRNLAESSPDLGTNLGAIHLEGGYERKLSLRRWQLYGRIGAMVRGNRLSGDGAESFWSYGPAVTGGLRFYLNKHLSLTLEQQLYYLIHANEQNPPGDGPHQRALDFESPERGGNLLQLSLNFHFVRMPKNCGCGRPGS